MTNYESCSQNSNKTCYFYTISVLENLYNRIQINRVFFLLVYDKKCVFFPSLYLLKYNIFSVTNFNPNQIQLICRCINKISTYRILFKKLIDKLNKLCKKCSIFGEFNLIIDVIQINSSIFFYNYVKMMFKNRKLLIKVTVSTNIIR